MKNVTKLLILFTFVMLFAGFLLFIKPVQAQQPESVEASLDCSGNQVVITLTNFLTQAVEYTVTTGVFTEVVSIPEGYLRFLTYPLEGLDSLTVTVNSVNYNQQFAFQASCVVAPEPAFVGDVTYCPSSAAEDNITSLTFFAKSEPAVFEVQYDDPLTGVDHQFVRLTPFQKKEMVFENAKETDDPPIILTINNDQGQVILQQLLFSCREPTDDPPTAEEDIPQPLHPLSTYLPATGK